MDKKELMLLAALEMMEAVKLIDREDIQGYYECADSIKETGNAIKKLKQKELEVNNG